MKKKALVLVLIVAFMLTFTGTAFAMSSDGAEVGDLLPDTQESGSTAPPKPVEQVSPQYASDVLSVIPNYKNDNMSSTYNKGYVPVVKKNKVYLVLPLKFDASKLAPNMKSFGLSLDLGGRSDVFNIKNYDKKVNLKDLKNDELIVEFAPSLAGGYPSGSFPVYINVNYMKLDENGKEEAVTEAFLLYVNLEEEYIPPEPTDVPEPTDEPDDGGDGGGGGGGGESAIPQPKVIMSEYKVQPDPVYAGDTFTVTATLLNTSDKTAVQNMTVSFKGEGTDMMPEGGGSTVYVDKIDKQSSSQFTIKMSLRGDAEPGVQKIGITYEYEDSAMAPYSGSDEISVQVRQHVRLEYDEPSFPTVVYIGDSGQASLNLYNKGKNTLYNVDVKLDMEGFQPESSVFLGNMETGVSKTADIYFNVGYMADTPEVPVAAGSYEGNIIVSYEDEYGEVLDIKIPVQAEIMEMMMPEEPFPGDEDGMIEEQGFAFQWWAWVIIAAAAAIVVGAVLANRREKKRERALLEEMDEDDAT